MKLELATRMVYVPHSGPQDLTLPPEARELLIFAWICFGFIRAGKHMGSRQRLRRHTLDLTMPAWSTARFIGGKRRGKDVGERFLSDVTPPELQSPRFQ
jgi:hypothetical protein